MLWGETERPLEDDFPNLYAITFQGVQGPIREDVIVCMGSIFIWCIWVPIIMEKSSNYPIALKFNAPSKVLAFC